ncbi:MAG: hypothetical protein JF595_05790 [Sphingomonadales bacterium]|nr:hypothetical protein [Sphingomonadales bacterium]
MKRLAACLALLALVTGAQAQERRMERGGAPAGAGRLQGYANPSAAIAAEIAFAQLARDKGQWTAFKATAAPDAVMFAPAMVLAQTWLKDRANPATALAWQAHQVWSSCDGSLMVTTGAWQRPDGKGGDKHGWFTTVWQRQPKGGYKWVFDHGDETKDAIAEPEMIAAHVADCPERRSSPHPVGPPSANSARGKPAGHDKAPPVPFDPTRREGRSDDGTLTWRVTADAAGTHDFSAQMKIEGQMQEIRTEHVAGG